MRPRDRRALWGLAIWGAGLGILQGVRLGSRFREAWRAEARRLEQAQHTLGFLAPELVRLQNARAGLSSSLPAEWTGRSEDQIRLKGQDTILAAAQTCGIRDVRIQPGGGEAGKPREAQRWVVEGVGTLPQWISTLRAIEQRIPNVRLETYRLSAPGDASGQEAGSDDGPPLQGRVTYEWLLDLDPLRAR